MTSPHDVTDASLRMFVAAATEGSFSGAARRLDVGQPAVSHAVARLETALGARVFERSPSGISLTATGRRLHEEVAPAYAAIDGAVAAVTAVADDASVTLSVSTSLASYWLIPRLADFKRENPGVDLRVITTDSDRSVGLDDADLWIPLGVVDRGDLVETLFCEEELVPVAAPEVAETLGPGPADLVDAPLLHLEERYATRFDWEAWFAVHDVGHGDLHGYRSNDYSLILQAALDGQGVALGWWHIVRSLVESGRLVSIGEPITTDRPFPILARRNRPLSPRAAALRDWLASQF